MKPLRLLLLMTIVLMAGTMAAQELSSQQAFDGRYRDADYATETVVQGSQLKPYGLTLYRGLTVTNQPQVIRQLSDLVQVDSRNASDKEERLSGGRINYGFYEFKPEASGRPKRFVFFFSRPNKAVLIYMEGDTDMANIKRLIKK